MCLPNILSPVFMFAFIFQCRSFQLCWTLAFLMFSQPLWIFMFKFVSFVFNHSLLLFLSNNVEKDTTLSLLFLSKSLGGHAIFFQIKPWVTFGLPYLLIELFYTGMNVVPTDGGAVGRCTVTWLPNFLGWVVYYISLPMVLRARELRYKHGKLTLWGVRASLCCYYK